MSENQNIGIYRPSDNKANDKPVVNRRAEANEKAIQKVEARSDYNSTVAADPQNIGPTVKNELGKTNKILLGRIQYVLPFINSYRVALEDGEGVIPCCRTSSDSGFLNGGVHDYSVLPPNTPVVVLKHHSNLFGFIIAAYPEMNDDGNSTFAEWLVQGSGVGIFREGYYSSLINLLTDEGGTYDFSKGMPIDSTAIDWGRITSFGGGIHIDPYMCHLRIDEITGLQLFYHDQLARLSGHNLDIWAAGYEQRHRNDRGEIQIVRAATPYYWEAMGALTKGANIHTENRDLDIIYDTNKAKISPTPEDLAPFYRFKEEIGYLGQVYTRTVAVPPDGETHTLSSTTDGTGVFREQILMDGTWSVESAKRVILAKRTPIPRPKQVKLAEDYSDDSDNADNYKSTGLEDGSPAHKVGDIQYSGEDENLVRAAASDDTASYVFNWQGLHPYHYHKNDYKVPEESDLGKVQQPRDFSALENEMNLPLPESRKVKVDDRYGEVEYFDVLSALTLTEDGGFILKGGGGESIQAVAGNIIIDCPGNIYLRSGKSLVCLSGDDTVIRTKNSVDISATDKDVSIKAENNMRFLSGNSGTGGMLFDCRSESTDQEYEDSVGEEIKSSGIVFKSAKSQVALLASEIYLRTGSSDGSIQPGPIVLDADKGNQVIRSIAATHIRHIGSEAKDCFGIPTTTETNIYSASATRLGAPLDINGQLRVNGPALIKDNVMSADGTFSAAHAGDGKIRTMRNPSQDRTRLEQIDDKLNEIIQKSLEDYQTEVSERYYEAGKIGEGETQKKISFSFRNEEQYGTTNFRMLQPWWQTIAPDVGRRWEEKVVLYQESQELMPWPGKRKWAEESGLVKPDLKIFDPSTGNSKDRTDPIYENPEYGSLKTVVAEDEYKILG